MQFFVKCKLPWPKNSCHLFASNTDSVVQDTLVQTWESLVSADNCAEFVSALTECTGKKVLPVLNGILERYKDKMNNGKLLYTLITAAPAAKNVRSALRAHLMKLSRDEFLDATTKLSVIVRDNSDLVALLAHFKLKELPPPAVPIRLPTFEKYELTPERTELIT